MGLAGVVLSNLFAHLLKFDEARIRSGFYGFNGILFGAALAYYYELTPFLLAVFPVFIFMTFLIVAVLENAFAAMFNLPGLSLPFVLALFISIVFLRNYDGAMVPAVLYARSFPALHSLPDAVSAYFHSLSLIFFQPGIAAGIVIGLGILIFSRVLFVLSLLGFAASYFFLHWLLPHHADQWMVVAGFNSILAAIALGGSLIIPSRKSALLALIAVLMVVIFTGFFAQIMTPAHLPMLVLPFNVVVLTTLYSLKFRQKTSGLVLLYFQPGSPEENFYYHRSQQARFEKFKFFMADLPISGEWLISQGHNGDITHKSDWKHAWDFVVADEHDRTYQNGGTALEDFHCYRLPVTAPLDGEVALVVDSIPNNTIGEVNLAQNWGNTIILNHGQGLYSALSHLEPGTARVAKGDQVKRGQVLALCGNSGRSPEPHLHFQFQATDRLGDKTISYPFGYYLESNGSGPFLRISAFPVEQMRVQNIVEHRSVRAAFRFPFGSTYEWECTLPDGQTTRETWTVEVDIYNALYLKSSAGATLGFTAGEKVFYASHFQGNRRCALYYFYLCAAQVPMTFLTGLRWQDTLPLSKVFRTPARYVSELLLLLGPRYEACLTFSWDETIQNGWSIVLKSALEISSIGHAHRTERRGAGELVISSEGDISSFQYSERGRSIMIAKQMTETTKELALV